ncbi:hypothetical protein CHCC20333_4616 [Bacillus paralicheniformis]|nr:hypothetical protein CHCC20333_4616 [Bacillus paralicheniformis]
MIVFLTLPLLYDKFNNVVKNKRCFIIRKTPLTTLLFYSEDVYDCYFMMYHL